MQAENVLSKSIESIINEVTEFYVPQLHGEQIEALKDVVEWYFDESQYHHIVLSGAAGTGKTYCTQRILQAINDVSAKAKGKRLRIAICAPTHKAVSVLHEYAQEAGLHGAHISTIHSLLHVIPGDYDDHGNQKLKDNRHSSQPHASGFDLIWCDEASMLDDNLYDYTQKYRFLFTGDIYQLPPSTKDTEEIPNNTLKLSPVFTLDLRQIRLTQLLRYDGEIAIFADRVRVDMERKYIKMPVSAGNITCLDTEDWENLFIEKLRQNPVDVRAIAFSNVAVNALANKAKQQIFNDDAEYHVGEVLAAREMVSIKTRSYKGEWIDDVLLYSCQEAEIHGIEEIQRKIPDSGIFVNCFKLDLHHEKRDFTLYTPTKAHLDKIVKPYLKQMKETILVLPSGKRNGMWREYYEILKALNLTQKGNSILYRLAYAGTMTINQSQGSGYPHIFLNISNIMGCKVTEWRNRLIYTGATRAKKHLYLLCKNEDVRMKEIETKTEPETFARYTPRTVTTLFNGLFC